MIHKQDYIKLLTELALKSEISIEVKDIANYLNKLTDKASIVSITENQSLKAFIAYYKNDFINKTAFLSMLAVSPEAQGKGLGKQLLETSIKDLKKLNFKLYQLEVLKNNTKAIALYKAHDFVVLKERDNFLFMQKKL